MAPIYLNLLLYQIKLLSKRELLLNYKQDIDGG